MKRLALPILLLVVSSVRAQEPPKTAAKPRPQSRPALQYDSGEIRIPIPKADDPKVQEFGPKSIRKAGVDMHSEGTRRKHGWRSTRGHAHRDCEEREGTCGQRQRMWVRRSACPSVSCSMSERELFEPELNVQRTNVRRIANPSHDCCVTTARNTVHVHECTIA